MTFKENEPGIWKPEKDGDNITGVLIKIDKDVGKNNSMLYSLKVKEEVIGIWGSAILDQRMLGIKIDSLIRVTFKGLGEPTGGHNAPKIFKVEYDDGKESTEESPSEKTTEDVIKDFPA